MTDTQNHPDEEPDATTSTPQQSDLDYKINLLFGGSVVRKETAAIARREGIDETEVMS